MLLRVSPDDLAGGAVRLCGDGSLLRGLAALLAASRGDAVAAAGGHGRLAEALAGFLDGQQAALTTLAEAAELLTLGLGSAAMQYREAETSAAALLAGTHG